MLWYLFIYLVIKSTCLPRFTKVVVKDIICSGRGWLPCVSCALKKKCRLYSICFNWLSGVSIPRPPQYRVIPRSPEPSHRRSICSAQKNLWRPKHPGVAKGGGSRGLRKYRGCSRAQQATFRNQLMDLYESRYLPHPGNPSLAEIGLRQISVGWSMILPSGNFWESG